MGKQYIKGKSDYKYMLTVTAKNRSKHNKTTNNSDKQNNNNP